MEIVLPVTLACSSFCPRFFSALTKRLAKKNCFFLNVHRKKGRGTNKTFLPLAKHSVLMTAANSLNFVSKAIKERQKINFIVFFFVSFDCLPVCWSLSDWVVGGGGGGGLGLGLGIGEGEGGGGGGLGGKGSISPLPLGGGSDGGGIGGGGEGIGTGLGYGVPGLGFLGLAVIAVGFCKVGDVAEASSPFSNSLSNSSPRKK